jgi:uncharacterized membrane protein
VKQLRWVDQISVAILATTFAATLAVYARLPEPMPTHFDLRGNPDGWMARPIGAWLLPCVVLVIWVFTRFGLRLLPADGKQRLEPGPASGIAFATGTMLCAIHMLVIHAALHPPVHLGDAVWVVIGLSFAILGQVMPRVRRNRFVGVRTPWTLASDENWAHGQRAGGYAFTLGGAAAALFGALGMPAAALASLAVMTVVLLAWSWRRARAGG